MQPIDFKLRDAIYKALGIKLEDMLGMEGCIIKCYSVGLFHKASLLYYRYCEEMECNDEDKKNLENLCGFKPHTRIKFSCCGFQQLGISWKEKGKYPKNIKIYRPLTGSGYKASGDVHTDGFEILGIEPSLAQLMMALGGMYSCSGDGYLRKYNEKEQKWELFSPFIRIVLQKSLYQQKGIVKLKLLDLLTK